MWGGSIDVPAYIAFQETPLQAFWPAVVLAIAVPEVFSVFSFESPFGGEPWTIRRDHVAGDLGFDPLGLLPDKSAPERRKRMLEQELTHGRTAMLAIVGFAIQEFLTKVPVVEETPQFFVPPEGVEQAFFPHVGENFFLRKDVEAEFYLFELVGEILKGFLPTVPH